MADKKPVKKQAAGAGAKKETKKEVKKETKKVSDKFAVIKTGGKQILVKEGQKVLVELTGAKEKEKIEFSEVLLVASGQDAKVGTPTVKDAKVEGTVLGFKKSKKTIVFKMKAKKRYRKTQGHRQNYAEVLVDKI